MCGILRVELLKFYASASFFKRLLCSFSFFSWNFFLNGCRCTVNDCFSFTKTKTSNVLNSLNNRYFLRTSVLKNDSVVRFCVFCRCSFGSRTSNSNCSSSWLDAVFVLKDSF